MISTSTSLASSHKAQGYIRRLEEIVETEVILISLGSERNETIFLKNPFDTV